jgi:hypothetical protein
MSTYATTRTEIDGSANGPNRSWLRVSDATVYCDHPVHAMAEQPSTLTSLTPAADCPTGRS